MIPNPRYKYIFSIIIPTYNRQTELCKCLSSICNLDFPKEDYEVIVVDDGSPNFSPDLINEFESRININIVTQENKGPASARNKGALIARGQYLVFTDDDCMPHNNWLKEIKRCVDNSGDNAICGKAINRLYNNIYSKTSQLLVDYLVNYYNKDNSSAEFFTSNNVILSKILFTNNNHFDPSFPFAGGEDRDLCDRINYNGNKIIYSPKIVIDHYHYLNLNKFIKQHYNYGKGAYMFHKLRALRGKPNVKIEPIRFYINLVLFPFKVKSEKASLISFLLLTSQVCNGFGYIYQKFKGRT